MIEVETHIWFNEDTTEIEKEFFPPGWYFSDEAYDFHGPFESIEEAKATLQKYCEYL